MSLSALILNALTAVPVYTYIGSNIQSFAKIFQIIPTSIILLKKVLIE